jgi:uncharacterized protein
MQNLKLFLALWVVLGFCSCKIKTVTIRYEGRIVEKYEVLRKNNVRHGYYKIFHDNGNLAMEHTYTNGTLNGLEKIYHEDGTLSAELPLKDGDYHGHFVYYYPDGKVKQRGYYKEDVIVGEVCTYYRSGQTQECVTMKDNLENGAFREYSPEGVLTKKGNYITLQGEKKGVEDGLVYEYDAKTMKLIFKKRCKEGYCCVLWDREKGYLEPSTSICDEIMNSTSSK